MIARHHARMFIGARLREDVVDDVALLVAELVANSVCHAGSSIRLEMRLGRGTLRVEVFDESFELPVMQPAASERVSGRGLQLVDAIATRWGARRQLDGKVVWFELTGLDAHPPVA
jgi:anti-sigma regulatory factor (Ser/Thr protein kinase)